MKDYSLKSNSLFKKIVLPMIVVLLFQAALLSGVIIKGGTIQKLDENAFNILNERVSNRRNYLQNDMIRRFTDLDDAKGSIEKVAQEICTAQQTTPAKIETNSETANQIIFSASDMLIDLMKRNSVSGVFLILDGADGIEKPEETTEYIKSGIYIRDLDPVKNSRDNSDLLLECSPLDAPKILNIPLDSYWDVNVRLHAGQASHFYYKPFGAALQYPGADYRDLAYWSHLFSFQSNGTNIITYSIPLTDSNGRPFGVMGIELSEQYLKKYLPYDELTGNKEGAYVLGVRNKGSNVIENIVTNGPLYKTVWNDSKTTEIKRELHHTDSYELNGGTRIKYVVYGSLKPFTLYNTNTPFENEEWVLLGVTPEDSLLGFTNIVRNTLFVALLVTLVFGIVTTSFVASISTKPIKSLVEKMLRSDPNKPVLLERTNITEIDELIRAMEHLSHDVADNASKLSQIISYAQISMGAFEWKMQESKVFYTKDWFSILKLDISDYDSDPNYIEFVDFKNAMETLKQYDIDSSGEENVYIIKIQETEEDSITWVSLKIIQEASRIFGVVKDITKETNERQKIEYERDYDVLTSLLNRRAFDYKMSVLFRSPQELKIAALIMYDLDNLKFINDTYGHDIGDGYIKTFASVLKNFQGGQSLSARMSGDEFFIFLYGYEEVAEIRYVISCIQCLLKESTMLLPGARPIKLRASAGIAWYPQDSEDYKQLVKYADFAMYKIKKTIKGEINDFDKVSYEKESYLLNKREELNKFIEEEVVDYCFQPIIDAHTGEVFAYEALMRSGLATLKSPMEILTLAKSQSKLNQIERLTWFKSLDCFLSLDAPNNKDALIFVNSVASQVMSDADFDVFENKYKDYLHRIVVEITEEEQQGPEATNKKRARVKKWGGKIALDDFGTGYNGEVTLLDLKPDFIKIDISIVSGIDKDKDRQIIIENIISYAKNKGIKIIAEGVETLGEMTYLINHDVDYLQGYYLCEPNFRLLEVSAGVKNEIGRLNQK